MAYLYPEFVNKVKKDMFKAKLVYKKKKTKLAKLNEKSYKM